MRDQIETSNGCSKNVRVGPALVRTGRYGQFVTTPPGMDDDEFPGRATLARMAAEHAADGYKTVITKTVKTTSSGSPEMSIWAWGLIAVGLVALRVVIVSRGNPETALALLQNLNVTAIVLATLVPFLAVAAVFLFCVAIVSFVRLYRNAPKPLTWDSDAQKGLSRHALFTIVLGVFVGATVHYAMPSLVLLQLAALASVVTLLEILRRKRHKVIGCLGNLVYALAIIAAVLYGTWQVVSQDRLWLPKERIDVGGWWDSGVVYILSSDEVWTKYLDDKTRQVRVIPTESVKARHEVHTD